MTDYLINPRRTRIPGYIPGIIPQRYPPLTNLALWLDANSFVGTADGTALASWSDKSGNNRNATQSTEAYKPRLILKSLNDLPGVYFDGTNDRMIIAMTTPAWGATVGTYYQLITSINPPYSPFGWSNRSDDYWYYTATKSYIGMFRNARLENVDCAFTPFSVHIITVESGASIYNIYENTTLIYATTSNWGVPATGYIGSNLLVNSFACGIYHETLIYNVEHSSKQRTQVWEYLDAKWKLGL